MSSTETCSWSRLTTKRPRRSRTESDTASTVSAAFFCRPAIATLLLEHGAEVNARDAVGLTALHWAACAEITEVLVARGADVSASRTSGLVPLHTAVDVGVVRVLLDAGATLEARDRCGNTPLHFAASMGLSFGGYGSADASLRIGRRRAEDDGEQLPLWALVLLQLVDDTTVIAGLLSERFDVAHALLAAGADVSARNETGASMHGVMGAASAGGDD